MEYISHTISDAEAKRLEKMEQEGINTVNEVKSFFDKLDSFGLVIRHRTVANDKSLAWITENMKGLTFYRDPGYEKTIMEIRYTER